MDKLKVIFIGGLTNGKIVYQYLEKNKFIDLALVITYPDNTSKPRFVNFPDKENVIKTDSANKQLEKIRETNPDLIFVAGWSELLADELIDAPKIGTIGFHPSKLPYDRGRSVLAWQIEEGYTKSALTMFYYNQLPDGGDIIASERFFIDESDYINDVLDKVDEATYNLMHAYFPLIRKGKAPRIKQDINQGTFRRLRKERDSWINWNSSSKRIYDKIRAISTPYPGSKAELNGEVIKILEGEIVNFNYGVNSTPGTVVARLFDNTMIIKTKDGFIKLNNYEKME